VSDELRDQQPTSRPEERVLDPTNLEAERHGYLVAFEEYLLADDDEAMRSLATELSPGDLSEILRPLSVEDTARILRLLPADPLAEVLSEIDNRSLSALFTLLDIDEIADVIEEMPSDEATDVIGELADDQAQEILAAMEPEERDEVTELLQYESETAGGLMGKEFVACDRDSTCGDAIATVRSLEEDDLEELHFIFVVEPDGRLVGRLPLVKMLLASPPTPVGEIMEPDPLYVPVDLDQEDVAQFCMTHDLITLPVVDDAGRLVGRITADDVLDVVEDEATEDISRLAGVSVAEFGEQSFLRVARSRLPWLFGALLGQIGAVLVLSRFEASLEAKVALAFFIPVIMGMAGNIGIQTSSVVVRGLATGEVDFYHLGRHMLRELLTSVLCGLAIAAALFVIALYFDDLYLAAVVALSMLMVIIFAAAAGTGVPLLLHRAGADPAVATGPFITTANDIFGLLIYLGLATVMLSLGTGPG